MLINIFTLFEKSTPACFRRLVCCRCEACPLLFSEGKQRCEGILQGQVTQAYVLIRQGAWRKRNEADTA